MKYRPRVLKFHTPAQLAAEMRSIGSEEAGVQIMVPKGDWFALRLEDVPGKAASLLKQSMLSLGGEACVSRQVAAWDETPRPAILLGDRRHYARLTRKLKAEPFGLAGLAEEIDALLRRLHHVPEPIKCGNQELHFEGPALVMGIINMTIDSFSGDGLGYDVTAAVNQAKYFAAAGASLLDVGGESTRPGSEGVTVEAELARVLPVIRALAAEVDLPISIDSHKPPVCAAALEAGAVMINDISGLRQPEMIKLAAATGVPVSLMHMQGQPRDMQHAPEYQDVITEIYDFLSRQCDAAVAGGMDENQIIIDPGFGFGKTTAHNLEIVRRLGEFRSLGRPVLLGASRKRTLGEITGRPVEERMVGSVALHTIGIMNGANIVRVHDVPETMDAVRLAAAVKTAHS
jgi:dihydropteroate synthase